MNGRGPLVVGVLAVCAAPLLGQQQAPVFRADTSAVTVNVSVKNGNVPVPGLTADDFRLYDNDVLQDVTAITFDAVPVDVSLVVDTSGSTFPALDDLRDGVRKMTQFLRPIDRVRVLTMGNAVVAAIPWQSGEIADVSAIALADGQMSLIADSTLVALLHRAPPDRRHLTVALTDGFDRCSLVPADALRRGAERSGAVLHWIKVLLQRRGERVSPLTIRVQPSAGVHSYCRWSGTRTVDMQSALSDAARVTGGGEHVAWYGEAAATVGAFDRILDDFRHSYILHYIPEGVDRGGWHRLRVEMTTSGYTVRARPGYWGQ
jgi:VWFA-related protein